MARFSRSIVSRLFDTVSGKRIALLGFAFKKNTGDVRESAAAYVAALLLAERAELRVYDPRASPEAMAAETRSAAAALGLELDLAACLGPGPDGIAATPAATPAAAAAAAPPAPSAAAGTSAAGRPPPLLSAHGDAYAACEGAHAVVVLTEWPEFRALDWRRVHAGCAKPAFVFDGRNLLDPDALRAAGFEVLGIGKPPYSSAQAALRSAVAAASPPSSPRPALTAAPAAADAGGFGGAAFAALGEALAAATPPLPLALPTTSTS